MRPRVLTGVMLIMIAGGLAIWMLGRDPMQTSESADVSTQGQKPYPKSVLSPPMIADMQDRTVEAELDYILTTAVLDDETYERFQAGAEKFAAYIMQRPLLRDDLILRAASTSENRIRRVILSAFSHLPATDRRDIGLALIASPDWDARRGAVKMVMTEDVMTELGQSKVVEILSSEHDPRVKVPLLKAAGHIKNTPENKSILNYLTQTVAAEPNTDIRGEALIAKTRIIREDLTALPLDITAALQSQDPDYQMYGLLSVSLILDKAQQMRASSHSDINKDIEAALYAITIADSDAGSPELIALADALYFSHY